MSSSMQNPCPLSLARYGLDAKSAVNAPGLAEDRPSPINAPPPRAAAQSHLLLVGCDQALRLCCHPRIFDDYQACLVDDADCYYSTTLPIIHEHHRPDVDHHVVKSSLFDSFPHPRSVHASRSEITYSLNSTNLSARYQSTILNNQPSNNSIQAFTSFSTLRSLTESVDEPYKIMTTVPSAPGSPPDLSGSRSSGSTSSYCSSSPPSGGDGIGSDITHYEDISLEDEKPQLRATASAPLPPSSHSNAIDRPTRPNISHQIREAVRQHESESRTPKNNSFSSLKRGHTNPALFPNGCPDSRTRSVSPPKRLPRVQSTSAMSATSLRPDWQSSRSSLPLPPRRASWNPRRKSVQELEEECTESDEDLPDDASLWNVPVSPHVAGPGSSRSSFVGSPTRSPIASPRPFPLDHARAAAETAQGSKNGIQSARKQKFQPNRSASANAARSNPSSPSIRHLRRSDRARSWNLAMEELSEEARIISQNLAEHEATKSGEGGPDRKDSLSLSASARPKEKIQLPPIQKGSLDFMPISKEKEAVLSRTRPSWLPPKDPKEEQKHLKEYQRMMAASLEADKKRHTKQQQDPVLDETTNEALARIWQFFVDESTNLSELDPRVYSLCWRGVTPRLRGKVWKRGFGNRLGLTSKSYYKALERAQEIQSRPSDQLGGRERQMIRWFKDIERDAETAFPDLKMFQQNGPLWQDLVDVCKAHTCYRSDIGYVYGMQLIAALLLLQLPTPADVFVVLGNALHRGLPLAFLGGDLTSTTRTFNHAVSTLAIKFPRIHEYLFGSIEQGGLGLAPEQVFEPMFRTLFSNGLDVDRLCRVWDMWVFEGDKILVHTAVALVGCLQTQLFQIEGDVDLKRRNIQEMLAWGPFNRTSPGEYWKLQNLDEERFVEEISIAGKLDYRGK